MNIKIVKDKISKKELEEMAEEYYFPMIKGVVDISAEIVAFGGEYHNDANIFLQEKEESLMQKNIWGFNLYLDRDKKEWLEYVSLINIRPKAGNMSMEVNNKEIRDKMKKIIDLKIHE